MKRIVEENKTLIADGPASVTLISGEAEVFGFQPKIGKKVIIRDGKRLPFFVKRKGCFDVGLGARAGVEEVKGDSIPSSWIDAYKAAAQLSKSPSVVMVVGGVDSGKSSFCTYLANKLITENGRVAILDEDLGQSDIGPPGTVAYAYVTSPVTDLFNLKPENTFFIGETSPIGVQDKTVDAVVALKDELLRANVDFMVVNTDGWTTGEEAIQFKSRLASALKPEIIFCLENSIESSSLCVTLADTLEGFKQERVDSPVFVRERNRDSRRSLRELGFAKYLNGAKVKVFQLSHIRIEGKESHTFIEQWAGENVLVGLYDSRKRFLGIGVLREVDYRRRALKILTAVTQNPVLITFGKVQLDMNVHEVP